MKFVDQSENIRFVASQQILKIFVRVGAAGVCIVIRQPAAGKGFINLRIQVFAVGTDQKGEIAAELAVDFAREKDHGIGFARALGMPEHA